MGAFPRVRQHVCAGSTFQRNTITIQGWVFNGEILGHNEGATRMGSLASKVENS